MARPLAFLVGRDPSEARGGHASYVRAHARAAGQAGFEPHLFCPARDARIVVTGFGVVHRIRVRVPPGARHDLTVGIGKSLIPWHAPVLARAVERFLWSEPGSSLVHGFATWSCAAVLARRRLGRRGRRVAALSSLYTPADHEVHGKIHGLAPVHGMRTRLRYAVEAAWIRRVVSRYERLGYTGADVVLVNYRSVQRLFEERFGAREGVRRVAYCSEAAFQHGREPAAPCAPADPAIPGDPDAPLIVAVSRQDPRKGLDILLDALADLRATGLPFRACLVGGGHLLASHRRLVERLGLADRVTLPGWVADPYPYLRAASVYVLPSLQEGSGSVALLEALQAGVAVVASDLDGIPEDVTHGTSALLVPPGSREALGQALARVLADQALREALARGARQTYEARFRPERLVAALREVYAELELRARS